MKKILLLMFTTYVSLFLLPNDKVNTAKGNANVELQTVTFKNKIISSNTDSIEKNTKEFFEIQFQERGFYQVERVLKENEYGSTKSTQIYYSQNNNYYRISTNEFTETNIIPKSIDTPTVDKIKKLPF